MPSNLIGSVAFYALIPLALIAALICLASGAASATPIRPRRAHPLHTKVPATPRTFTHLATWKTVKQAARRREQWTFARSLTLTSLFVLGLLATGYNAI